MEEQKKIDYNIMKNRLDTFKGLKEKKFSDYGQKFCTLLAKNGFIFKNREIFCFNCKLFITSQDISNLDGSIDLTNFHLEKNPKCSFILKIIPNKIYNEINNLYYEKYRIETFIEWSNDNLNPADLAKDGFYFLKENNFIACIFCYKVIQRPKLLEDIKKEHSINSNCPLILNEKTLNVPLKFTNLCNKLFFQFKRASEQKKGTLNEIDIIIQENKRIHKKEEPKHKQYENEGERRKSFLQLSKINEIEISKLVDAGFFFKKEQNCCILICFFCNGSLKNWCSFDDPWIEHIRYFPNCLYVKMRKEQSFLTEVHEKYPPRRFYEPIEPEFIPIEIDDNDIFKLTSLPLYNNVTISSGKKISEDIIFSIIKTKILKDGCLFTNIQDYRNKLSSLDNIIETDIITHKELISVITKSIRFFVKNEKNMKKNIQLMEQEKDIIFKKALERLENDIINYSYSFKISDSTCFQEYMLYHKIKIIETIKDDLNYDKITKKQKIRNINLNNINDINFKSNDFLLKKDCIKIINSLKKYEVKNISENDETTCLICFEKVRLCLIPCAHFICKKCFIRINNLCPICRSDIIFCIEVNFP